MLGDLWSMIRLASLALPVHSVHSLADFKNALAADADRTRDGKVLIA
jgi:hypothetical protein